VKEYEGISEVKIQVGLKKMTTYECDDGSMKKNGNRMKTLNGSDTIKITDIGLWMFLFSLPDDYSPEFMMLELEHRLTFDKAVEKILLAEQKLNARKNMGSINQEKSFLGKQFKVAKCKSWLSRQKVLDM
jgi:hypothetical protein